VSQAGLLDVVGGAPSVPTSFTTDAGNATPIANVIEILGEAGVLNTSGSGKTVTINLTAPVSVAKGGTGQTSLTDGGVLLGSGTGAVTALGQATNGQLVVGSIGADPVLATITAGSGISVTNAAGSITIANTGGAFTWTEVTGTTQALAVENGYIANNAGLVTLTLPATAAIGDSIQITGKGLGLFKIAQNAGQTIRIVASSTTTGVTGSLTAIEQFAALELVCITTNTDWIVVDLAGNYTVV
jgi:hypothetical protein